MEFSNRDELILVLKLTDRRGREIRVSDCDKLTVKVYTQTPNLFLNFHKRDITQGSETDRIVIADWQMKTLPSGVVKYEYSYESFRHGEKTAYTNTVTTDQYWKNSNHHGEPSNPINYRSFEYLRNLVEDEARTRENEDAKIRGMFTENFVAKLDEEIRRSTQVDIEFFNQLKASDEKWGTEIDELSQRLNDYQQKVEEGNETAGDKIEQNANGLAEEIERAKGAEKALQDAIDEYVKKATNAINKVKNNLTAEITRAKGEEERIENLAKSVSNNLDSEITRAKERENEIASKLQSVETELQNTVNRSNENDIAHKADIEQLKSDVEHIKGIDFGSIEHALTDAKHYTDDKINELKSGLSTEIAGDLANEINRAKAEESRLDSKIDATNVNVQINKEAIDKLNSDLNDYATKKEVDGRIEAIIGNAPEALDTLGEIANELQKNDSVHQAINEVLTGKANKEDVYTKNEVDNQFNTYSNALTQEVNRAMSVESGLSDSINSEASTRQSADEALEAKIKANSDAIEALQNADNNEALQEEINRAKSAESGLNDAITSETSRAMSVEGGLDTRLTAVEGKVSDNATNIAQNTSDIAGEVTRATNKEAELEAKIQQNAEAIQQIREADNSEALQAEVARAKGKEAEIETSLSTEQSERLAADNALGVRIDGVVSDVTDVKAKAQKNENDIVSINAKLDVINGDDSTAGSIAHALEDSKHYTDDEIAKLKLENSSAIESALFDYAKKQDVDTRFEELVGTAPSNLDTLGEIAKALTDQNDVVAGLVTTIASKASNDDLTAEKERAMGVEATISGKVSEIEQSVTTERNRAMSAEDSLSTKITGNTEAINTEVGERKSEIIRVEGLINSATSDLNDVKGSIQAETQRATLKESQLETAINGVKDSVDSVVSKADKNASDIADLTAELNKEVQRAKLAEKANADAIEVINGDENTIGSIKHSLEDSKHYTDDEIAKLSLTYATKEAVEQVEAKIPTNVSQLVNDVPYLTQHQSLEDYATKSYVDSKISEIDVTDQLKDCAKTADVEKKINEVKAEIPSLEGYATESWVEEQEYLKEHQDISGLATKVELESAKSELEQKIEDIDVTDQLTDYAKKEDVCNVSNGEGQQITEIVITDDENDDTVEVYSKAQVDAKLEALKNSMPKISEPMSQEEYDRLGEYDPKTLYVII